MGGHFVEPRGGLEWEADVKHAEKVCSEMGVQLASKGLDAPAVREVLPEDFEEERDDPKIDETKWYRGVAASANFLSLDRMDIQFGAKEVCRQMSAPRSSGVERLKRMARYLAKYRRLVWRFGR